MPYQTSKHCARLALLIAAGPVAACGTGSTTSGEHEPATSSAAVSTSAERDLLHSSFHGSPRCEVPDLSVELLARYETGLDGLDSSGETAALRGNRLYVTSAEAVALDVVDVSRPAAPVLRKRIDLKAYGSSVQSVAVSRRGLVAVATASAKKTDPGSVVLLDADGRVLRSVPVGSLPDMVTFTHAGDKLLVANEGEPDCYGIGCTDPEGSISIIDVSRPWATPLVKTARFVDLPIPAGVRIFGPGASAAQDLEPEYITVSADDRTAYVTLQENNAVAVVNIRDARVTEVRPLGFKDFSTVPTTSSYVLEDLPSIGATAAGQELKLGGFSGLFFEGIGPAGHLQFATVTDRGPNGEPVDGLRPFLLPDFSPRIVRLQVNPHNGRIRIVEQIQLRRPDGTPISGLPNTSIPGGSASTTHNDEIPIDLFGNELPLDPMGGDFEGIVVDSDGSFWLADEYRPAIYHFDASGLLLARLVPMGSHVAAGLPAPAAGSAGELGIEALPSVLGQRRQNRGFEAIAMQAGKLYAFVQSPLRNPETLGNSALNAIKNVRLVEVAPITLATRQFIYLMDNPESAGTGDTRADKIGDATALPGGGFMVVERDDDALPASPASSITKRVYAFNLQGATDISSLDSLYGGKSLDQMTRSELSAVGVQPIAKVLHTDLTRAGYASVQKVEGLAFIDPTTFAVINDNDFGVASITIDTASGSFQRNEGYVPEPVVLGLVKTSGLDASDKDRIVNIRDWPVFGMYQPDAIASFESGRRTYLVTANEGDARDYDGFAEEVRARSVASLYPGLAEASDDLQLGRLTVTSAPPAGDFSRPYLFGTRSFSIWDAQSGALVWDSGADLENHTAQSMPAYFNSNNDADDFDSRSDNKGPEPEGIAVGQVRGRTYAFVGLERVGGVVIYDVSVPSAPKFVQYLRTRVFGGASLGPDTGPEVVKFVPSEDSPTRTPLLMVAHEISGTVTLWRLGAR